MPSAPLPSTKPATTTSSSKFIAMDDNMLDIFATLAAQLGGASPTPSVSESIVDSSSSSSSLKHSSEGIGSIDQQDTIQNGREREDQHADTINANGEENLSSASESRILFESGATNEKGCSGNAQGESDKQQDARAKLEATKMEGSLSVDVTKETSSVVPQVQSAPESAVSSATTTTTATTPAPSITLIPSPMSSSDMRKIEQNEKRLDKIFGLRHKRISTGVTSPLSAASSPSDSILNGVKNAEQQVPVFASTTTIPPVEPVPIVQLPTTSTTTVTTQPEILQTNKQSVEKRKKTANTSSKARISRKRMSSTSPPGPLSLSNNDRILLTSTSPLLQFQSVAPANHSSTTPLFINPLLFYHLFIRTIQKYTNGSLGCVLFFYGSDEVDIEEESNTVQEEINKNSRSDANIGQWNHIQTEFNQLMKRFVSQVNRQLHTGVTYTWNEISIRQIKAIYLELISKFGGEEDILRIIIELRIEQMEFLHAKLERVLVTWDNAQVSSNSNQSPDQLPNDASVDLNITNVMSILQNQGSEPVNFDDILNMSSPASQKDHGILNFSTDHIDFLWKREQEKYVDKIMEIRRLLLFGEERDVPHVKSRIALSGLANPFTYDIPRELWHFDRPEIVEYVNNVNEQHPEVLQMAIPKYMGPGGEPSPSPVASGVAAGTHAPNGRKLSKMERRRQNIISKNRRLRQCARNVDSTIRWSTSPAISLPHKSVEVSHKRPTPKHSEMSQEAEKAYEEPEPTENVVEDQAPEEAKESPKPTVLTEIVAEESKVTAVATETREPEAMEVTPPDEEKNQKEEQPPTTATTDKPPSLEVPIEEAPPATETTTSTPSESEVPIEEKASSIEAMHEEIAPPHEAPKEESEEASTSASKASRKRKRQSLSKSQNQGKRYSLKRKTKQQRIEAIPNGPDRFEDANTVHEVLVEVMEHIKRHESYWIFQEPVDMEDYDDLVKHRVDLTSVEEQIKDETIDSVLELWRELLIMFQNAQVFTPPHTEGDFWENTEKMRWDIRPLIREALEKECSLRGIPVPPVFRLNFRPMVRFEPLKDT
eukprot:CAMPEP_0117443352 /NCGR_PEP_ID=MMETSP0759-20121206/4651_1 /TAXON_ID=63605 /ORGANISM="Percolomonas cosmopolitus, Strain WS" /LENGTH=1052 /DNA_ID=CAMNT_0005235325 /DNA_START=114 /DNA_END=3272 /DNA_ORIENTATION=-